MNQSRDKGKKMSKWLFYALVIFTVVLLIFAIISKQFILGLLALLFALFLKPYSRNISLPDAYLRQIGMEGKDISLEELTDRVKTKRKKYKNTKA